MKKTFTVLAIILIVTGLVNAVFALIMMGAAAKNPATLTTSVQESRIDDLVYTEGCQEKVSQTFLIYLIISLIFSGLGVFAFLYLKNLPDTLDPKTNVNFGDSFIKSSKISKETKH